MPTEIFLLTCNQFYYLEHVEIIYVYLLARNSALLRRNTVAASRGAWGNFPPSRRLFPLHLPPSQKEKIGQNQPLSAIFFYFCPLRKAFCPLDAPTKISGAAIVEIKYKSQGGRAILKAFILVVFLTLIFSQSVAVVACML